MSSRALVALATALLMAGCFNELLPEQNLSGTVVVPGDLIEDSRDIGMVYMGVFEGWDPEQLGYSYPATGPRVGDNPLGVKWMVCSTIAVLMAKVSKSGRPHVAKP